MSDANGETWQRQSPAPLLDRSAADPLLTASPCVLRDGGTWRMWYVSGARWTSSAGGPRHYYHIRYAESDDGLTWRRDGRTAIDFKAADEYAIARPCVVKDRDGYRMWYSGDDGRGYRIGYAESADGIRWTRLDERAGIAPVASSWEEVQAYPWVVVTGDTEYLLYNGNDFGRAGVGLAVRSRSPVGPVER